MKSHLFSIVLLFSVCLLPFVQADQSEFAKQTAFSLAQGPAVFTLVKSGTLSHFIIGYGKTGSLGNQWSRIIAHMKVSGSLGGERFTVEKSFPLDRVSRGKGYVSSGMDFTSVLWYDFTGGGSPEVETIEFTFRINDRVDSNLDRKYEFKIVDVFNTERSEIFESNSSPSYPAIAPDIWEWVLKKLQTADTRLNERGA